MIILTRMEIILTILQIIVRFYLYGYIERRKSKTRDSLRIINQATLLSRSIRSLFELRRGKVSKGSKNCVEREVFKFGDATAAVVEGEEAEETSETFPEAKYEEQNFDPLGEQSCTFVTPKINLSNRSLFFFSV